MITFINILIWFVILFVPIFLGYFIYACIKKKPKQSLMRSGLMVVLLTFLLIIFYWPKGLDFNEEYDFIVRTTHESYLLNHSTDIQEELVDILESYTFSRSTEKTVFGVGRIPYEEFFDVWIPMLDMQILVRRDQIKYTNIQRNGQLYNIINKEQFVEDIVEFVNRLERDS